MKSMRDHLKRASVIRPINGLVAGYGGNPRMHGLVALAARFQGLYYLVTGLWPLVNHASFERITGPKQEAWLVQTVGGLIAVIGAALLVARTRRPLGLDVVVLAVGSALALAIGDLAHSSGNQHPWVYSVDAGVELAIALLWIVGWRRAQRPHGLHSLPRILERQGAS